MVVKPRVVVIREADEANKVDILKSGEEVVTLSYRKVPRKVVRKPFFQRMYGERPLVRLSSKKGWLIPVPFGPKIRYMFLTDDGDIKSLEDSWTK